MFARTNSIIITRTKSNMNQFCKD